MILLEKWQTAVIRYLLIEFAQIIEVYCKMIVDNDGNRMREYVVYDCVEK